MDTSIKRKRTRIITVKSEAGKRFIVLKPEKDDRTK